SKDQFVTLGLNEPQTTSKAETTTTQPKLEPPHPPIPIPEESPEVKRSHEFAHVPEVEPPLIGAGPTPLPLDPPKTPVATPARSAAPPQRSSFSSSILGLDLPIEELQAREAALEQEFSARFRRAVEATRDSLSERIDTVFAGRKRIDDELLDHLEEALIAADIGVSTSLEVLETVRRAVDRKQINDLDALKQAIKDELLRILEASTNQGVSSETSVPENVSPYVMMIVGVNGVGKTTTIGKLAQRIKAE